MSPTPSTTVAPTARLIRTGVPVPVRWALVLSALAGCGVMVLVAGARHPSVRNGTPEEFW